MKYAVLPFVLLRDRRLKPSDKLVLMALQRWGWRTQECFPSDGTIAGEAGLSRRAVQLSLGRLAALGLIQAEPTKGNPTGRRIVLTWMADRAYLPPLVRKNSQCAKSAHEVSAATRQRKAAAASRPACAGAAAAGENPFPSREAVADRVGSLVRRLLADGRDPSDIYDEVYSDAGAACRDMTESQGDQYFAWVDAALNEAFDGASC